tara:strand:- start:1992 stop:2309 length:318 start_codon:yes stop_codon:yes gene_type:complete
MTAHLKQSLAALAYAGAQYNEVAIWSDEDRTCKAERLQTLIFHTKEMLQSAIEDLEADETETTGIISGIQHFDDDNEIPCLLKMYEFAEHENEPSDFEEHSTWHK